MTKTRRNVENYYSQFLHDLAVADAIVIGSHILAVLAQSLIFVMLLIGGMEWLRIRTLIVFLDTPSGIVLYPYMRYSEWFPYTIPIFFTIEVFAFVALFQLGRLVMVIANYLR